jgi:hypothetical protein
MSRICPAFLRPEAQALLPVPTNRDHVNYYDVTGTKGRGKVYALLVMMELEAEPHFRIREGQMLRPLLTFSVGVPD